MKMKSAYELALERLAKDDPQGGIRLSDDQKQALADLDAKYRAKIAEREIFLTRQIAEARGRRDAKAVQELETQLRNERLRLQEERDAKKDAIRRSAGS